MNKKEFPLAVHQNLNYLKKTYIENFKSASPIKPLMRFEDKDEQSSFYFSVNTFEQKNGEFYYQISYKPTTENDLAAVALILKFPDVEKRFKNWKNIIDKFDSTSHFSEDPIVESYTNEYFDEYKILEDDANIVPFDIKRQILIDKYLDNSIKFLETFEQSNVEIDLSEPKALAIELKLEITSLTKNEVIRKLSKFWAISRKKGFPILKEIFFELAKEIINELGKKMLGM